MVRRQNHIKTFNGLSALLLMSALFFSVFAGKVSAASVQLTINVPNSSYRKGDTVDAQIKLNSAAEPITVAQIYTIYDPTLLQFESADYSNSSFSMNLPAGEQPDSRIVIGRFATSPVAGESIVGNLKFKVIAESGSTGLSVDSTSSKVFGKTQPEQNLIGSYVGASFSIRSAASTPDTTQSGQDEVVIVVPNVPTNNTPIVVDQGAIIKLETPSASNSGKKKVKTEYYVNDRLVGSSENGSQVQVDTSEMPAGTYEVASRSVLDDGTVEESSQTFVVESDSLFTKYKLPIIIGCCILLSLIAGLILLKRPGSKGPQNFVYPK